MDDATVDVRIAGQAGKGRIGASLTNDEWAQIKSLWPPGLVGAEDAQWDWAQLAKDHPQGEQFSQIRLVAQDRVQGFAILRTNAEFRSTGLVEHALELMYLSTAPWSRKPKPGQNSDKRFPRVTPVGQLLLIAVIQASHDLGFEGRLVWHSEPGAEEWYREGFGAPAEYPNDWDGERHLTYFEANGRLTGMFIERCKAVGIEIRFE